jgi:hypothetical protein
MQSCFINLSDLRARSGVANEVWVWHKICVIFDNRGVLPQIRLPFVPALNELNEFSRMKYCYTENKNHSHQKRFKFNTVAPNVKKNCAEILSTYCKRVSALVQSLYVFVTRAKARKMEGRLRWKVVI